MDKLYLGLHTRLECRDSAYLLIIESQCLVPCPAKKKKGTKTFYTNLQMPEVKAKFHVLQIMKVSILGYLNQYLKSLICIYL